MTPRERTEVISFCADHVKGRVPVIAGSGSNSTSVAVSLSQEAEKAGADGLLLVTPYYNKASQTGLIQHYRTIADAVNVPCILYNVPSRTGVSIAPETYAELAKHPNITGTKERVESIMGTIVSAFEKQLDSLFGADAMDISTDISVLETMLAREGLAGEHMEAQSTKDAGGSDIRLEL